MLRRLLIGRTPLPPRPLRVVWTVLLGAAMVLAVGIGTRSRNRRLHVCGANRAAILAAEQKYFQRYNRCVLGDEAALQDLVSAGMLKSIPRCNYGGHYVVSDVGNDMIVVNCSFDKHEEDRHSTVAHMQSFPR